MRWTSLIVHVLIGLMVLVPFSHYLESDLEASAAVPMGFHSNLLLSSRAAFLPERLPLLERMVISHHVVDRHENLYSIAKKYHVDQFSIRSSNDLDGQDVPPGTVLRIPNHKGTLYEVKTPENLQSISRGFSRGKTLGPVYDREILIVNRYPVPNLRSSNHSFDPGTFLFLPEAWKPTGLPIPFTGGGHIRITSRFGKRKHPILGFIKGHHGLDIAKPYGTPVIPSREGIVTFTGWLGGYGNMIEIRHVIKSKNGARTFFTRYGHLSKICVRPGQHVHLYQLIGRVGSSGLSTGPHLHFEVRDDSGHPNNPQKYL